ncbi:sulfite exporter TauE/SafE family protein [Streptacidiphilus sp. ASG 303]|uniref:sulfite exporter TauE/SafE family protein n=1 Tax=Streptacidiphilus sp. ASG 303 TaxID=2896847 RepID=UPI001E5C18D1|nr:sulfite exporter TauE/SafE family protein [Streptacidiphilus sp. ASG 303]MCD0485944.1 sulfite exporter TauE/SafE family protein [Streptacidiphilus sp. ASG 303]
MTALVLALVAGAVVGLALGGLGGGGSMLAVPALIYLLGFAPAQATTAALLIVAVTSATGLVAHARAGRVRWRTGALFAAAGLPAAAAAGALSSAVPGAVLTLAFALLAAVAAWRMLTPRRPAGPPRAAGPGRSAAAGAGLGAVTGLLGVGGGFLAVPALVSVLALPMAEAVGTSLLVITANSAAALVPRLGSAGSLDWAVVAPFTAAAVLGAWDGKRLADRLSGPALQRIFAFALLAVAALMLLDALT